MKKHLIITLFSLLVSGIAMAQEYKVRKTGGKMTLDLSAVTIAGYDGNEVIFSPGGKDTLSDPRAKGLKVLNGSGYTDNTGLGIDVIENGNTLEVHQVANLGVDVKILVPRNISFSLECHRMSNTGKIEIKNMTGEIAISADKNPVTLENVTGPLTVRALYDPVVVKFSSAFKGPVAIASVYSNVEVYLPQNVKATVKLASSHGEILAAPELKIALEKNTPADLVTYGNVVSGKINGGGEDFKLTSEYGKIYLRTK
jgi:hypothetical protein